MINPISDQITKIKRGESSRKEKEKKDKISLLLLVLILFSLLLPSCPAFLLLLPPALLPSLLSPPSLFLFFFFFFFFSFLFPGRKDHLVAVFLFVEEMPPSPRHLCSLSSLSLLLLLLATTWGLAADSAGIFVMAGVADLESAAAFGGLGAFPPLLCHPNFTSVILSDDSIPIDVRYATYHNFVGSPVPGYVAEDCWLTIPAAMALVKAHQMLRSQGYLLKVYDCYRPQKAVDHFVKWGEDLDDQLMKEEFYPYTDKEDLFKSGYIANKSGHTRGSTVDVTIIEYPAILQPSFKIGEPLYQCTAPFTERWADSSIDMGTGFDCFDPKAHSETNLITPMQQARRLLLRHVMEMHNFVNYEFEWWHFTLKDEPFPDTYFDFDIDPSCLP